MTTTDYTEKLPLKAAEVLINEIENRLKKDIGDEIMEPLRKSLEEMKVFYETTLRESSAKQNQTIEMLQDRLLGLEAIRTELSQEIDKLKKELTTALDDKAEIQARVDEAIRSDNLKLKFETLQDRLNEAVDLAEAALKEKTAAEERAKLALLIADEAEKKFHQANNSNETLNTQLNFYKQELATAVTLAESFLNEKIRLEKKLAEFQEHWGKYLANSQDKQ